MKGDRAIEGAEEEAEKATILSESATLSAASASKTDSVSSAAREGDSPEMSGGSVSGSPPPAETLTLAVPKASSLRWERVSLEMAEEGSEAHERTADSGEDAGETKEKGENE